MLKSWSKAIILGELIGIRFLMGATWRDYIGFMPGLWVEFTVNNQKGMDGSMAG